MAQLRVVVADESAAFRTALTGHVEASGVARVVAHARDARDTLAKLEGFRPDVVLLDLDLAGPGLETLRAAREAFPAVAVVVVSSGARGAEGVRALGLGAFDLVHDDADDLASRIAAVLAAVGAPRRPSLPPPARRAPRAPVAPPLCVGIGASTGGPSALQRIVPELPADLAVPVFVVQHMPPPFTSSLVEALAERSAIRVVEARHGEAPRPGTVYVAPGGRHLRVGSGGGAKRLELTDDPPENFCRPAVDVLFRSLAGAYRDRAMGVILTGMGRDGTAGLRAMREHGAVRVVGQSAESCTVYGMPREAMNAGVVDVELPAERIARAIVDAVAGRAVG